MHLPLSQFNSTSSISQSKPAQRQWLLLPRIEKWRLRICFAWQTATHTSCSPFLNLVDCHCCFYSSSITFRAPLRSQLIHNSGTFFEQKRKWTWTIPLVARPSNRHPLLSNKKSIGLLKLKLRCLEQKNMDVQSRGWKPCAGWWDYSPASFIVSYPSVYLVICHIIIEE